MDSWLKENPTVRNIRTAVADLNGIARGKRVPASAAPKLATGSVRMPYSVLNVDIKGDDIEDSPLVFETGDRDGTLRPTERGFVPAPWLATPAALLPMWMFDDDGAPFQGDPRHALRAVLERYKALGLRPVVATELEFYLTDDTGDELRPPISPRTGKRLAANDVLSLDALDSFDAFFTDIYEACDAMGIPADAAISEGGIGQYEINLMHSDDALKAADDAWLFKMLTRGLARKHGLAATFMAKPYASHAGTGLHTHFSILDANGTNIFDDGGEAGTPALRHAIAGCLAAMPASMLIFAPHGNSYERFTPGAHAPTGIAWAYENRTSAIRVPAGPHIARRIEHRVAGGDANPYLMLATVLGAALIGLEDEMQAPAPITGSAYDADLQQLPTTWAEAIKAFEASPILPRILPQQLIRNFAMTKTQEAKHYATLSTSAQIALYLDAV